MGLDQYAGTQNHEYSFEDCNNETIRWVDVGPFEWRKHARLQEFMTRLAMKKKGIKATLGEMLPEEIKETKKKWIKVSEHWYPWDLGTISLTLEDIVLLKETIENGYKGYESEGGFFWGHQFQEEQRDMYKKQDLDFVEYAMKRLADGKEVYYKCSF